MTVIGIHPDLYGKDRYYELWKEFLEKCGVQTRILNLLAPDALEQAKSCDGIMWRIVHCPQDKQSAMRILYIIEHYLNIPVFPDFNTAWHYDEKIAQYYLFQALGVPTPKTWLFWDRMEAEEWAQSAAYPVVFKLSSGASSTNVRLISSKENALQLIGEMFDRGIFPGRLPDTLQSLKPPRNKADWIQLGSNIREGWEHMIYDRYPPLPAGWWWKPEFGYVYFQEFIPGNEFDTRIVVIGDRAFGFRRYNRPGDFRASGAAREDIDVGKIDLDYFELAFRISEMGHFQSMAYDILSRDGSLLVTEISYAFPDYTLKECPGHYLPNLEWMPGKMYPQEAQVEVFLSKIRDRS